MGSSFDEAPEDGGKYVDIISNGVFQGGWNALKQALLSGIKPAGAVRWAGFPPNKIWCSTAINAPASDVWNVIRDFAGMAAWHEAITDMHMIDGVRSDTVSGTRDFLFDDGNLHEKLLHLDDRARSFSYCITKSPLPWLHYISGPQLFEVTDGNATFATWTGDWVASPLDDLRLIPLATNEVYLKAFGTVAAQLKKA